MPQGNFGSRALPVASWPERDRRAWIEANSADLDDLLAVDRPALHWRAGSKEMFVRYYGIWLAWLMSIGELDLDLARQSR
jgi:hypothetical protein